MPVLFVNDTFFCIGVKRLGEKPLCFLAVYTYIYMSELRQQIIIIASLIEQKMGPSINQLD